jgi:hypothetical protein
MKNDEMHLNEEYFVEFTKGDNPSRPLVRFPKLSGNYVRFPFPKDSAIRCFHRARREAESAETVSLWRSTPELHLCAIAEGGSITVTA